MRVLTLIESRELDRRAIDETGIPGLVLMENAAIDVVEAIALGYPEARRIGIVAGPGNNGADGLAVARQLDARGYDLEVRLAAFGRRLSAECASQLGILRALGIPVVELEESFADEELAPLAATDLLVDALFGSGLTRPLEGPHARLVTALGELAPPVLAVDLPSGLDGDRAAPIGPVLAAATTVTFVAPKPALVLPPACELAGELVIGDLGYRVSQEAGAGALHLLVSEELGVAVPRRPATAHKGSFGHALLVAGSEGKGGAMVLAARAAVAAGAGLTTVALAAGLESSLAAGCPEAMSVVLPATAAGTIAEEALDRLLAAIAERSVVALGPGLGRDAATDRLIRTVVSSADRPIVLDADGLNAFAGDVDALARRRAPAVLTPHPGELARLLEVSTAEIQADRLASAREAARRSDAVVVLKGHRTLIAHPDGEAWINATGNPGMASGGSGDVLTGLIAARLAQGDEPVFAAALSVHLHGLAGDLALARCGGPAVPATELLAELGAAYATILAA